MKRTLLKTIFLTSSISLILFVFLNIKSTDNESKEKNIIQKNNNNELSVVGLQINDGSNKLVVSCSPLTVDITKAQAFKLYQDIKTQLQIMQTQGIDENIIDFIAHKANVGTPQGRILRQGYETSFIIPPHADETSILANLSEELLLQELIEKNNPQLFSQAILEGKLADNKFYPGKKFMAFIFGKIIESIPEPEAIINELLEAGMEPQISDFLVAINSNIEIQLLERMYQQANFDAQQIVYSFGVYKSLVLSALFQGNYQHATFWMDKGSPLEPDKLFYNALDMLAANYSVYSSEELNTLYQKITKTGLQANFKESLIKLAKVIPDLDIELNEDFDLTKTQLETAEKYLTLFYSDINIKIFVPVPQNDYCFNYLASRYIGFALKTGNESKSNVFENNTEHKSVNEIKQQTINVEVKTSDNNIEDVQSISAKEKEQKVRRDKLTEAAKAAEEKFSEKENKEELESLTKKLVHLIQTQQWQQALELLQSSTLIDTEIAPSLLLELILDQMPPIDFVEYLIEAGAKLSPHAVTKLIKNDHVSLAEFLLPYGLDLNYIDPLGYSALINSVKFNAINLMEFMLLQGITFNEEDNGFDALDIALQNFKLTDKNKKIVNLLIQANIPIEESHRQWVANMAHDKLNSYTYLINTYPLLRRN